jgi:hypothetical protein
MSQSIEEKLNALRENVDKFGDGKESLAGFERQLGEIQIEAEYLKFPLSIWLNEYLYKMAKNSALELATNRKLSEDDRIYLFALKEIAMTISRAYSRGENENRLDGLEKDMDNALNNLVQ